MTKKDESNLVNRRDLFRMAKLLPVAGVIGGAVFASGAGGSQGQPGKYIEQARIEFGGTDLGDVRAEMKSLAAKPIIEIFHNNVSLDELPFVEEQLKERIHGIVKDYVLVEPRSHSELVAFKPVLLSAEDEIADTLSVYASGEISIWQAREELWSNFARYLDDLESIAPAIDIK